MYKIKIDDLDIDDLAKDIMKHNYKSNYLTALTNNAYISVINQFGNEEIKARLMLRRSVRNIEFTPCYDVGDAKDNKQ